MSRLSEGAAPPDRGLHAFVAVLGGDGEGALHLGDQHAVEGGVGGADPLAARVLELHGDDDADLVAGRQPATDGPLGFEQDADLLVPRWNGDGPGREQGRRVGEAAGEHLLAGLQRHRRDPVAEVVQVAHRSGGGHVGGDLLEPDGLRELVGRSALRNRTGHDEDRRGLDAGECPLVSGAHVGHQDDGANERQAEREHGGKDATVHGFPLVDR